MLQYNAPGADGVWGTSDDTIGQQYTSTAVGDCPVDLCDLLTPG